MAEDTQPEEPEQSNPVGRPLKYKTADELDLAIQLYFDKQDPHVEEHMVATGVSANGETMFDTRKLLTEQRPYTIAGLARALGIDRRSLLNYKNRDEYFPSIQAALDRCEEYAESQLYGPYANGAKFNLTNNYRGKHQEWSDRQEIDHTTKGKAIAAPVTMPTIKPRDDAPAQEQATAGN
jgi:hypothetical protein